MDDADFRETQVQLAAAGFDIIKSDYDNAAFGSWFVEVKRVGLPRQQVIWDGRDKWLVIQFLGNREEWWDKATLKDKASQTVPNVVAQTALPVTPELQALREAEQAEYWAAQIRGGWVITGED